MPVGATARGVRSGAVVAVLGAMGALACGSSGDGAPAYELRMPSPEAGDARKRAGRTDHSRGDCGKRHTFPNPDRCPDPDADLDSHGRAHASAHATGGGALPEADAAHGGVRQP